LQAILEILGEPIKANLIKVRERAEELLKPTKESIIDKT